MHRLRPRPRRRAVAVHAGLGRGDDAIVQLCGVSLALSFVSLIGAELLMRAGKRRLAR